jgi:signal peptide peptidase SppA
MKLTHVLQAVASEPWAILPDKLGAILAFLDVRRERRLTAAEIRAALGEAPRPEPRATVARGIAVLPVHGVLLSRTTDLAESSGVLSTPRLGMLFDQLMDDESVSALVLDVDSPGGMVGGVPEFAAKIAARRGEKRVVAVVNHLAASAAWWIASQADEVVISPSGECANIGVITARVNLQRQAEEEGVDVRLVTAGPYKAEGHPFAPVTEEEMAALQARVDAVYDQFVKAVAKGRGRSVAEVKRDFGGGRLLNATDAVRVGAADRIGTMEDVLAKLGRPRRASRSRRRPRPWARSSRSTSTPPCSTSNSTRSWPRPGA